MKAYCQTKALARILTLAVFAAGAILAPQTAHAQTFKVLYSFTGGPDGAEPNGGLRRDPGGNLYGTTIYGGSNGPCFFNGTCGVAFELTPTSEGWQESTLYTFAGGSGGGNSYSLLALDPAGNLYGTAFDGGANGCSDYGCGVLFELTPASDGWDETVLYSFSEKGSEGGNPIAGLVFDRHGNLYGTLPVAGNDGTGTVYELTEDMGGWTEKTIHDFGNGQNGCEPEAAPIVDKVGNLYGITSGCGSKYNVGTVFELAKGSRKERTLYTFGGGEGAGEPSSSLVFDKAGNLYGTTQVGGKYNKGTVFRLTPGAKGKWKLTTLYSFKGGSDGDDPLDTPIFDKAGNLYGTTSQGGDPACSQNGYGCGTVFKLTTRKSGQWKEAVLHRFTGGSDGASPSGLVFDAAGNLYGTTYDGGNAGCDGGGGCGVVFEITP